MAQSDGDEVNQSGKRTKKPYGWHVAVEMGKPEKGEQSDPEDSAVH
jgi:hypothetical protein